MTQYFTTIVGIPGAARTTKVITVTPEKTDPWAADETKHTCKLIRTDCGGVSPKVFQVIRGK